mmetsp:Transcript_31730/g.72834  ORF Transcript_31730/g.72834 Transcript_31730/m.72834 type:complete len:320 (-) Transcript_31730:1276-2235(-)
MMGIRKSQRTMSNRVSLRASRPSSPLQAKVTSKPTRERARPMDLRMVRESSMTMALRARASEEGAGSAAGAAGSGGAGGDAEAGMGGDAERAGGGASPARGGAGSAGGGAGSAADGAFFDDGRTVSCAARTVASIAPSVVPSVPPALAPASAVFGASAVFFDGGLDRIHPMYEYCFSFLVGKYGFSPEMGVWDAFVSPSSISRLPPTRIFLRAPARLGKELTLLLRYRELRDLSFSSCCWEAAEEGTMRGMLSQKMDPTPLAGGSSFRSGACRFSCRRKALVVTLVTLRLPLLPWSETICSRGWKPQSPPMSRMMLETE